MRQNSFPLRLPASLQAEARKTADQEGVSLNQLFSLAIAEKISVLRTEEFFRTRAEGASVARARKILKRAGKGPVREGDEVLPSKKPQKKLKKTRMNPVHTLTSCKSFLLANKNRIVYNDF